MDGHQRRLSILPGDSNDSAKRRVCVVGLGYVGLPTAALIARAGHQVVGVDIRTELVEQINAGHDVLREPGLNELLRRVVADGCLSAALSPEPADVFVVCVPTPLLADKTPDLSHVTQAAEAIRPYVSHGNLIVLESTCPPNTTHDVLIPLAVPAGLEVGNDVFVSYCPERVLPGNILHELVCNDRILGGATSECRKRAREFYESFTTGQLHVTDALTAEITKLAENSYRDLNIAFANEISSLAANLGTDPLDVIELANRHPRVQILRPGPGVGGHCIPVDPWFLVHADAENTRLIQSARQVNDVRPAQVVAEVAKLAQQHDVTTFGCLGLAYKADVDDVRESASLLVVNELRRQLKGELLVCDPFVEPTGLDFPLRPLEEVLDRSEMLVLLTDHSLFRCIPREELQGKLLVDPCGAWRAGGAVEARATSHLRKVA